MNSRRILIVRIGALGDIFFALPAVSFLKNIYPNSHITWLVGQTLAPVLRLHPQVDQVLTIRENKIFGSNKLAAGLEIFKTLWKLRRSYDLIVLLHRDTRWTLSFRALLGPIFQLRRTEVSWSDWMVHPVRFPAVTVNESLQIRELLEMAVTTDGVKTTSWEIPKSFWEKFQADIEVPRSYWVVHLGGGQNSKTEFTLKQWPYWSQLLTQLKMSPAQNIVLVGAPSESDNAHKILEKVNLTSGQIVNLVGRTNLIQLIAVIRNAEKFIGVDSGPLHIADAALVPCVGLYGPTSPKSWGLLGGRSIALHHSVPCSPCYKDDGYFPPCPYEHRCMVGLTVEAVCKSLSDV